MYHAIDTSSLGFVQNYPQYDFEENGLPCQNDCIQRADYCYDIGLRFYPYVVVRVWKALF
jgi:hypothetical protein